jgi:hypothetical protein
MKNLSRYFRVAIKVTLNKDGVPEVNLFPLFGSAPGNRIA